MNVMKVARRYARALFQLAQEKNELEAVSVDLKDLRLILHSSPEFKSFILNKVTSPQEQERLVRSIFEGRAQPLVLIFLLFLIERARLNILQDILDAFYELYLDFTGTTTATVSVGQPLNPELFKSLIEKLQSRTQKKILPDLLVDPALLGGFKVRIADQVYEASVAAQLKHFESQVLSAL